MPTPELRSEARPVRVILDVEGAREVGPTESAGLVRECLALMYRQLDAACWRALDELATAPARRDAAADAIAAAVRRERGKFFTRFRSEYDQIFAARRAGKPRARLAQTQAGAALALVDERDHAGQVALKDAVQAMRVAVREEGFGFDLRARIVMREAASAAEFDNPFGAELVCDALGNACRALWAANGLWRPIMERIVRVLTPTIVALHRDLNDLLQDRDILPVLRVRTRKHSGASIPEDSGGLYRKVADLVGREPPRPLPVTPPARPAPRAGVVADPLDFGNPEGWRLPAEGHASPASAAASPWSALIGALTLLERSPDSLPAGIDAAALREGTANALPRLAETAAAAGASARERVALEILAAVLDEVFDSPYLPAEIKTVFGRLQIPILKAALADQDVFTDPRHRVRHFFDTLAGASVGLRPDDPRDALFIALADHLAGVVRDDFADDLGVFATVHDALEAFLDTERAAFNQELAQAVPALVALDEDAAARTRVRAVLAMRLAGKAVPAAIRSYLEHDGLDRLTAAYLHGGPDGAAWRAGQTLVDDLVWSVAPEPGTEARRRLVQLVPQLVRTVGEGWAGDDEARARRASFLAALYDMHLQAMNAPQDAPPVSAEPAAPAASPPASDPSAAEGTDADSLMRGDWCVFEGEPDAPPLLARFAWRAPHGTQLLFTHRDGTIAVIHTPDTLARALASGSARVAVEAAPLFERAMERMLEQRGEA